jgi:hypothetical protein
MFGKRLSVNNQTKPKEQRLKEQNCANYAKVFEECFLRLQQAKEDYKEAEYALIKSLDLAECHSITTEGVNYYRTFVKNLPKIRRRILRSYYPLIDYFEREERMSNGKPFPKPWKSKQERKNND